MVKEEKNGKIILDVVLIRVDIPQTENPPCFSLHPQTRGGEVCAMITVFLENWMEEGKEGTKKEMMGTLWVRWISF